MQVQKGAGRETTSYHGYAYLVRGDHKNLKLWSYACVVSIYLIILHNAIVHNFCSTSSKYESVVICVL